jgi:hypothetical protein
MDLIHEGIVELAKRHGAPNLLDKHEVPWRSEGAIRVRALAGRGFPDTTNVAPATALRSGAAAVEATTSATPRKRILRLAVLGVDAEPLRRRCPRRAAAPRRAA